MCSNAITCWLLVLRQHSRAAEIALHGLPAGPWHWTVHRERGEWWSPQSQKWRPTFVQPSCLSWDNQMWTILKLSTQLWSWPRNYIYSTFQKRKNPHTLLLDITNLKNTGHNKKTVWFHNSLSAYCMHFPKVTLHNSSKINGMAFSRHKIFNLMKNVHFIYY